MTLLPLLCLLCLQSPETTDYDPLSIAPGAPTAESLELMCRDTKRNRDIPLHVWRPKPPAPAPVVLFSHGLGGNRHGAAYLGEHWSRRGYVVVYIQHPGSDDSVWKDEPALRRMAALRKAANAENYLLRVQDVAAVIDQLEKWNDDQDHPLSGQLDLEHVGMSGHSFGALTTQGVSGQSSGRLGPRLTDPRVRAALALSPSSPRGATTDVAFSSVKVPWMLMTGTEDTSPIGEATVESRLAVYPALPESIDKFELVLHQAEHSAFTERALPGDRKRRNPNHHRAILALSTAFWDAYLKHEPQARQWLLGKQAEQVLEPNDRWQSQAGTMGPPSVGK